MVNWAYADAAATYNLSGSAILHFASIYFSDWKGAHAKLTKAFIESLHEKLRAGDKHPMDAKLLSQALDSYLMRLLAHAEKDGEMKYSSVEGLPENIPSVGEAEQDWLRVRDALTRQYTATAYKDKEGGFSHTLRMPEPVTYRGSNKITGIIGDPPRESKPGMPDKGWYDRPKILYYGSATEDYLEQYHQRIG